MLGRKLSGQQCLLYKLAGLGVAAWSPKSRARCYNPRTPIVRWGAEAGIAWKLEGHLVWSLQQSKEKMGPVFSQREKVRAGSQDFF